MKMKTIFSITLASTLILTACGGSSTNETTAAPTETTANASEETTAAANSEETTANAAEAEYNFTIGTSATKGTLLSEKPCNMQRI